ncbi:hypothetical protein BH11PLA2_BH11PLA2_29900 [soil metagenome]
MADSAQAIGWRFREEREHIERYVQLLQAKSTLHDRQVQDLNRILRRVNVPLLPVRHYYRIGEPYTADELAELLAGIKKIGPEVYQTILGHEQGMDNIPSFGLDGPAGDHLERLSDWVDYFVPMLADDPEKDDEAGMIQSAIIEAEQIEAHNDADERIPTCALKALINLAMEHARRVWFRQRVDAMIYTRQQFEEIEVLARMATPDAEISVLRQGFVLLMTAFDAAVFDLTRIAFRRKFFELVGAFGKQDKVTLQGIGEAGSYEAFIEQVIEEQLKKRYVKDLLGLLQGLGVEMLDEAKGDKPVQLVEMVLRRNLHVHCRGVVDDRYLENDSKTGKPQYNLFDLKAGQTAVIDGAYFETALRLCVTCIERLAKWAGE